jgi:2-polyprenyl-6-methoxyphenol hydroxylase-like FAD-dependent oxidoreductase
MYRVLISGAGIAGPALAFWLRQQGAEVTIVERAPRFRDSGYVIDVWGLGYDLVQRMGLLEDALDRACRVDRLLLVDENGRPVSGFGAEVFSRALGGRFFSIARGDLARVVFDAVQDEVEVLYSTSISGLRQDEAGIDVELSSGSTRRFELVVGCDGLRSRVRECAFGAEERFESFLGYCAAAFVTDAYPHRDPGVYVSFARPGRQISRYALHGDRTAFLLVFTREVCAPSHDLAVHKRVLRETFGDDGWECEEILERLEAAEDVYFDAVSQIRLPQWTRGRIALVGDAAYCPSLLAGAGAAFAMLGAYVLAGELRRTGGDHVAAFGAYERLLHPFIDAEQRKAVRFAGSFAPRTAAGLALRNLVLRLLRFQRLGVWYSRRMFESRFELPSYG